MNVENCRCPACTGELEGKGDRKLRCKGCSATFPVIDGIPIFSQDSDYYFGEFPRHTFDAMLKLARETSTRSALRAFRQEGRINDYAYDYGTRPGRGSFFILLKPGTNSRILDLGCGWGTVSLSLARHFGQLYSMDLTRERISFLTLRARELGLDNVTGVCGGDTRHLPFPDNFFDCVVLNGVLEWVAENTGDCDPRTRQLLYLEGIHRVLKPDGQLYVAIENRFALEYVRGMREDHTGMLFTSLMPRFLANMISRFLRNKPYRTYTYSRSGYRRLFRDAGFAGVRYFIPFPNYRSYNAIFDGNDAAALLKYSTAIRATKLDSSAGESMRTHIKSRLTPAMSHSYSMVVEKQCEQPSWLDLFVCHIQNKLADRYGTFKTDQIMVSPTTGVGLMLTGLKGGVYAGIAVDDASHQSHDNQYTAVTYINSIMDDIHSANVSFPAPIDKGTFHGVNYFLYELVRIGADIADKKRLNAAADVCRLLHSAGGKSQQLPLPLQVDTVLEMIERHGILISSKDAFLARYSRILQLAGSERMPVHGDLWKGNIIADADGVLTVIDWTEFERQGLPLVDAFNYSFVVRPYGQLDVRRLIEQSRSRFDAENEACLTHILDIMWESRRPESYSVERMSALFQLYIYDYLSRRLERGLCLETALRDIVTLSESEQAVLPAIGHVASQLPLSG